MDSTEAPALPNFLLPCSGLTRASMDRPSRRCAMDPRVKPGGDSRSLALSHPRCGGRGIKLSLDRRVHAEQHLVHLLGEGRRLQAVLLLQLDDAAAEDRKSTRLNSSH